MAGTALIVEDEDQVLRLVVKVLEMRGYSVLQAGSTLQALLLSDANPEAIDLLVADVELDADMSGYTLARLLRCSQPRMRVLYTSGYTLDSINKGGEGIRKEIQEMMAAFLPKPFTPSVLMEKVQWVFEELPVGTGKAIAL